MSVNHHSALYSRQEKNYIIFYFCCLCCWLVVLKCIVCEFFLFIVLQNTHMFWHGMKWMNRQHFLLLLLLVDIFFISVIYHRACCAFFLFGFYYYYSFFWFLLSCHCRYPNHYLHSIWQFIVQCLIMILFMLFEFLFDCEWLQYSWINIWNVHVCGMDWGFRNEWCLEAGETGFGSFSNPFCGVR